MLETSDQFDISKICVAPIGKQIANNSFSLSVRCIECQRCLRIDLIIDAQVDDVREFPLAAGGTSCISKALLLKSPASDIPKILCVRQVQHVSFAANSPVSRGIESELSEGIFIIHQIVKRKTRKRPRRGQLLKECPMRAIGRIVIATASKVSSTNPRLQPTLVEEITRFYGGRVRALAKFSPSSYLHRSPDQNIRFADADIGYIDVVTTDCGDVDFSMIASADRKRAVIGLRHVTAITIVRGKHTPLAIT